MSNDLPNQPTTVEVIASPEFKRRLKALAKRYRQVHRDLKPIFEGLETGLFPGDQVTGTNYTVIKLRVKNSDTQTGKSGGYRLIYQIIRGLPDLLWKLTASSVVTQVSHQTWFFRQPYLVLTTGDPVEPPRLFLGTRMQF